MATIAYLGTGLLGSGFIEAALGRGDSVTVWNRTPAKAAALVAFGATVASTPADAVRGAERVHLVLKDDAVVEEVIAALRPGLSADAIIVDHTTTQPVLTAERAARLSADGVNYLHCPVFIGPAAARQGQGIIMASGAQALFDAVRPALEQQAQRVVYWGERTDLAAAYKLMGNAFIIGLGALVADVFTIAAGSDVEAPDALKLLEFFNPGSMLQNRGRKMSEGDFEASFELVMARKDVRLMQETAGPRPLAALPSIAARMDEVIAQGHGAEDFGVIARDALRR
ncbi:MAG TPA: NAD(P)-dependent oxidoreductase [Gemmatimonas aurantiaca]|uniref:NAD(P)-dependent oxidoreductase n=2 Tax=Gemmatimonas aurantiaca TaxID=173480 RepID=A0A3D4VCA0_9BACT|nr:NAD(P)-dependent oxidoreductase [Gemmatimonas aurantiaca]BAH37714.1 putative oxidoreductase [Gemmatimonas aurantiaca T-27]HCT58749.1 NAD(P)-dependent oxidoreductase [Gemmatimonas aurantiaca]